MRRVLLCCLALLLVGFGASEDIAQEHLQLPEIASSKPSEFRLGEKVALDHLGPLIVNSDGSLRRIANWQSLSEGEREVALRRVAKRNRERLAKLEEEEQQQQQPQGQRQEL